MSRFCTKLGSVTHGAHALFCSISLEIDVHGLLHVYILGDRMTAPSKLGFVVLCAAADRGSVLLCPAVVVEVAEDKGARLSPEEVERMVVEAEAFAEEDRRLRERRRLRTPADSADEAAAAGSDLYALLGVHVTAPRSDIKAAYRRRMAGKHPAPCEATSCGDRNCALRGRVACARG